MRMAVIKMGDMSDMNSKALEVAADLHLYLLASLFVDGCKYGTADLLLYVDAKGDEALKHITTMVKQTGGDDI